MMLRKKILMIMLACSLGFQPVAKAKHEDVKILAGILLLIIAKKTWNKSRCLFSYLGDRGYIAYRMIKHYRWRVESAELALAKTTFMEKLHEVDCKNKCALRKDCYPKLFEEGLAATTSVESFILGEEESDGKNPINLFLTSLSSSRRGFMENVMREARLAIKEKELFEGFPGVLRDPYDTEFFIYDALASIREMRRYQIGRFTAMCCGAFLSENGLETAIKQQYPDIKASSLFYAFSTASNMSNSPLVPGKKEKITKEVLFAQINLHAR
jgi:hypothetical protein